MQKLSKQPQDYIFNRKFTNKVCTTLFNLRSRSGIKFKPNLDNSNVHIKCEFCEKEDDTQEHALTCGELYHSDVDVSLNVKYDDMFQNSEKPVIITQVFMNIIHVRQKLRALKDLGVLTGANSGPSG